MEEILNKLKDKIIINLLFVCSGNIIRSVISHFLFEKKISENIVEQDKFVTKSGAILFKNDKIPEYTKIVLLDENISPVELDKFEPTFLKDEKKIHYLEDADIIIAMTKTHTRLIPKRFRNKTFLLTELVEEKSMKLPDVFGKDLEIIQEIKDKLKYLIEKLVNFFIEHGLLTIIK